MGALPINLIEELNVKFLSLPSAFILTVTDFILLESLVLFVVERFKSPVKVKS